MSLLDAPVHEVAWAAIDFEGTGAAPGQIDEAVQIGIAVLPPGRPGPENFFRSYVRAQSRVTRAAKSVHRITDEDIQGAPALPSLWPEIKSRLRDAVVVAHGVGTEKRFMRAFPMHGFGPWVDTLVLARALMPGLSDHSLSSVVEAAGLLGAVKDCCPGHAWHDALFDAVACLVFLRHCVSEFGLGDRVVGQLACGHTPAYYHARKLKRTAREAGLGGAD